MAVWFWSGTFLKLRNHNKTIYKVDEKQATYLPLKQGKRNIQITYWYLNAAVHSFVSKQTA